MYFIKRGENGCILHFFFFLFSIRARVFIAFDELNVVCNKLNVERHAENVNRESKVMEKTCTKESEGKSTTERENENQFFGSPDKI